MKNQEIARILYEIADILEIKGVEWKPIAYRKAARNIETLSEDVFELYKKDKLDDIPGVGKNIAEKIEELLKTGKLRYYEELKKSIPIKIEELISVPSLGPKRIKILYEKLKIKNLKDLKDAAEKQKIRNLEGFGYITEKEILEGIKGLESTKSRLLIGYMYPMAKEIESKLRAQKFISKATIAGSMRRMKETIHDVDILVTTNNPKKTIDFFTSLPKKKLLAKGSTKASIILYNGLQVDIRVLDNNHYGSGLNYFTGSKEHGIKLRNLAIKKGLKLSEYGIFKGKKTIASKKEEDVYKTLGLEYIEPELREDSGEIEFALKRKLPKLINYNNIKGDLHVHTIYSDGSNTIEEMALKAKSLGRKYIAITDHYGNLAIANALNKRGILKQFKEIKKINKKLSGITILKGSEVNINPDGTLDMDIQILKELDIVVASIHSRFKEDNTDRLIKAMENKYVNFIGHPTGRLINRRKPFNLDFEKIFEKSKETNTFLEINSFPDRLDLNDVNVRAAIKNKCRLIINTDSHSVDHLYFMKFGIGTARRGWSTKNDIINTNNLDKFLKIIER
ncbi:DNA polymerase/3'-5' exonuclease PolX [Candidatus Woesearchaeota archaeon]|nr:DNA polymerase/3'-5' exonuclease PolX [Candidatus Woesearchaeota archaeon]